MKKIYALLSPGEFVARHVNQNYADFSRQAKHEIKKGNRKLIWYAKIFPLCEYVIVLTVGLLVASFGLTWSLFAVIFIYLFAVLVDPRVWRKIYGSLARDSYKISFLLNLDMLYWFGIGWVIGWLVL